MYEQVRLDKVRSKFAQNGMSSLVNFAVEIVLGSSGPKASHLMIELVAIDTLSVDGIASVNSQLEVAGRYACRCLHQDCGEILHGDCDA